MSRPHAPGRRRSSLSPAPAASIAVALAVALAILPSAPASAQGDGSPFGGAGGGLLTGVTSEGLVSLMLSEGYRVEPFDDGSGDVKWFIDQYMSFLFLGRTGEVIRFYTGMGVIEGVTLEGVNTWNRQTVYGRSYIKEDGGLSLELELDLSGGVSEERLKDFLSTCQGVMRLWLDELVFG
jgi:hypothetical protein